MSIACWVVVFSPQIIENFKRQSADGLSLLFVIVWLAGDVFNILGAVLQGVLPTMVILAVYYTIADIVLLGQCFYYRGFTLSDEPAKPVNGDTVSERTALLGNGHGNGHSNGEDNGNGSGTENGHGVQERPSLTSFRDQFGFGSVDGTHLSPATPFSSDPATESTERPARPRPAPTTLQAITFNTVAVVMVCGAGVLGWYLSTLYEKRKHTGHGHKHFDEEPHHDKLDFDILGQVFGYFCAVLYLGSRVPQILLNYRRKSTEGVSLLFFLFACIGNLTYVLSIFAYEVVCENPKHCQEGEIAAIYGRYILVNLSWLVGSLGTLVLDMVIFGQFFMYRKPDEIEEEDVLE